jgi:2-polyprenyl-6-methoxyphenol hydroxylase-like FAD-dependent oxidoreductase
MTTLSQPMNALVVGAGIGGLAAALALARKGISSTVLEQADELLEIGAGIQLAPNALRVLDRLGVLAEVLTSSVRPARAVMRSATTGKELASIDFGEALQEAFGYPYVVTHRSDLHAALLNACRATPLVTVRTGQRVVGVIDDGDRVSVLSEDDTHSAPLVIGADGLHSTVRQHTIGTQAPTCTGDVAYRGVAPRPAGTAVSSELTWWVGPGMHLIQYPVRNGQVLNQVAVFTSTGQAAGADPSGSWGGPEELDAHFADKVAAVRAGAQTVDRSRNWKLFDREPDENWTRGRVTLLGDAAHPMLQYLAQGGCQALEDALVLAECVAAQPADIPRALQDYQSERLPRTGRVQRSARSMGDIVHGDGVTAALRDELLGQLRADDFRYVDWLYRYDYPRTNGASR